MWALTTEDQQPLLNTIHKSLSWVSNVIWTFNMPSQLAQVDTVKDSMWPAVVQAMSYSGCQALDSIPPEVNTKLKLMLQQVHPLKEKNNMMNSTIAYHGAKTVERIRGSPFLVEWFNTVKEDMYNHYILSTNKYRVRYMAGNVKPDDDDEDDNMHESPGNSTDLEG